MSEVNILVAKSFIINFEKIKTGTTLNSFSSENVLSKNTNIDSIRYFDELLNGEYGKLNIEINKKELSSILESLKETIENKNISEEGDYRVFKHFISRKFRGQEAPVSAYDDYYAILNKKYSIDNRKFKYHVLLLGDVEKKICNDLEDHYGVICYSNQNMLVEERHRRPFYYNLANTNSNFYKILDLDKINFIELKDRYILENFRKKIPKEQEEFIIGLINPLCFESKKHTNNNCKIKYKEDNREKINFPDKIKCEQENNNMHDRLVITSKHFFVCGNSFMNDTATYFVSFPRAIYSNQFYKNNL